MGGSAQGFQNLNNTQQQGVKNLGLLIQAIKSVFPQQTGVALTATAGTATLPAAPLGFIVVSLPSGASVKVPYYAS
jgi:hypothetical protein